MKPALLLGIAFMVLGALALAYQGFTYTRREKVLDIGPLQATAEKTSSVPRPPIVGFVALAAGLALVVVGSRK